MAITTNQRIMVAILKLADFGLLDCRPQLNSLAQFSTPNRDELETISRRYLNDAQAEVGARSVNAGQANERLQLRMLYAGYIAYDVRAQAQGLRGTPPNAPVWALLNAALTLLLARATNKEGRAQVVEWVKAATASLAEL